MTLFEFKMKLCSRLAAGCIVGSVIVVWDLYDQMQKFGVI